MNYRKRLEYERSEAVNAAAEFDSKLETDDTDARIEFYLMMSDHWHNVVIDIDRELASLEG